MISFGQQRLIRNEAFVEFPCSNTAGTLPGCVETRHIHTATFQIT
jgi:hypothetical protein